MENKKYKVFNQKFKYRYWIFAAFIVIIFLPLVVGYIIPKESIIEGFTQSNDWIGFFGSYTGSILGGVVTLVALYLTRKDTRQIQSENKRLQKKIIKIEEENQFREYRTTFIDFVIQDKLKFENSRSIISGNMLLKNENYDTIIKKIEENENLKVDSDIKKKIQINNEKLNSSIDFSYKVIKNIGEKPMNNVNVKIIGGWNNKNKEELVFNIGCIEAGKCILMPVFKLGGEYQFNKSFEFIKRGMITDFNITGMSVIYEMGMMEKREQAHIKLKYSSDKLSVEKSVEISKVDSMKFKTYKYNNYIRLD